MNTNRLILKTDSNGVTPTGFLGKIDGPTMFRKMGDLLERGAQGACAANLSLALNPVAALATVTTTHTGDETDEDTLTVANQVISMEASGASAASLEVNIASGAAGTSVSHATPALTATALKLSININGDGPQIIFIDDAGTHTGAQIAAKIQTAIRAVVPRNALNAVAYSSATCAYTTVYTITSGVKGSNSTVVVSAVPGNAGAANLKLGVNNGGTEAAGTFSTNNAIAALINGQTLAGAFTGSSTVFAGICTAFVCGDILTLTAAIGGTMGNGLALSVSSTGTKMVITHAFGAATAGTEGTNAVYSVGL